MSRISVLASVTGVVLALGIAAAVATPAAMDWYDNRHQESDSYVTGAQAKQARASVPRWLPDGASSVKYAMKTTGGERLLKAVLPGGELPTQCTAEPTGRAKEVQLDEDWFPHGARKRATARCGLYYAYVDGGTLYAWQHDQDWLEAERGARDTAS
ncbi:hypothetical protein [Streptomyces sp. NPDC006879]|uniref:hypothetical protein n=1 Tax=Streptomyces sp. NPDC006879 TaxID=3364767 RepID=UPI0036CF9AFD